MHYSPRRNSLSTSKDEPIGGVLGAFNNGSSILTPTSTPIVSRAPTPAPAPAPALTL